MTPEERREMIIRTALPLVAEHGTAVTTSQIARAAAIGEATIFRVFADKDELLDACVVEALRPDHALDEIAAIPLDQPLADRLVEAADAMRAHLSRIGTVIGALHASGRPIRRDPEHAPAAGPDRTAAFDQTREALTELLEPDRSELRLPPEQVAAIFLSLLFTRARPGAADPAVSTDELVDLFLNGALANPRSSDTAEDRK